jgi:DNA-binding NarL/FixJ family response regulator
MNTKFANCQVLVVDSSVIVLERIQHLLTEMDCVEHIFKASNYEKAVDVLRSQTVDIVLLDTQLPGNKGFDLLSLIKKSYPETKTIILTNQSGSLYRHKVTLMGSDHFIDKSSEFEKIVQIINEYAAVGFATN